MASRVLHLAAAELLLAAEPIEQPDRFRIGSILPDAYEGGREERWLTHFLIRTPDGGKMNDLTAFRARFGEHLRTDSLYLGYYMHLLEDMAFRNVIYKKHHWYPDSPEKVARIHKDYRLCNAWAIRRFGVTAELTAPEGFENEALCAFFPFCLDELLAALREDFLPCGHEPYFFFTEAMAGEFLAEAVALCRQELNALRTGAPHINESDWVWGG